MLRQKKKKKKGRKAESTGHLWDGRLMEMILTTSWASFSEDALCRCVWFNVRSLSSLGLPGRASPWGESDRLAPCPTSRPPLPAWLVARTSRKLPRERERSNRHKTLYKSRGFSAVVAFARGEAAVPVRFTSRARSEVSPGVAHTSARTGLKGPEIRKFRRQPRFPLCGISPGFAGRTQTAVTLRSANCNSNAGLSATGQESPLLSLSQRPSLQRWWMCSGERGGRGFGNSSTAAKLT